MLPALLVLAAVGCAIWAAVRMLLRRRAKAAHAGARPARAYGAAWRNRTEKTPDAPPAGLKRTGRAKRGRTAYKHAGLNYTIKEHHLRKKVHTAPGGRNR